jgi:hypothetical protein
MPGSGDDRPLDPCATCGQVHCAYWCSRAEVLGCGVCGVCIASLPGEPDDSAKWFDYQPPPSLVALAVRRPEIAWLCYDTPDVRHWCRDTPGILDRLVATYPNVKESEWTVLLK